MRVHHLQHVPFEGLGSIESVLRAQGHHLSSTHLYADQPLPSIDDIDWLIVMGGPMGIHDEDDYPWLRAEKQCIHEAVAAGKRVLGICLGAQFIADVLGARVYANVHREIGWFALRRAPEIQDTALEKALPEQFDAFHWHGDTFDLPEGSRPLAGSAACTNQGFIFADRVAALQFHLETTPESAAALIDNCRAELDGSQYVQSAQEIMLDRQRFTRINQIMASVVEALAADFV